MTKNDDLALSFSLVDINTNEFAIIDSAYNEENNVGLNTSLNFGFDTNKRVLGTQVRFQFEQSASPFLIIDATCGFKISDKSWDSMLDKETNQLVIPEGFASHMAIITVGTIRGILHEKTKETNFNRYILPPINLTKIIKEDVILDLNVEEKS